MKATYKNLFLLAVKLLLPSLLCLLLFRLLDIDIGYHILLFSLVIVSVNFDKVKYNYTITLFSSVALSYIAFFVSIGIYFGMGYILMQFVELDKLEEIHFYGYTLKNFFLLLPISIYSPLLMFRFYRIIFETKYNNFHKIVKWITIITLSIYYVIVKDSSTEYSGTVWQFLMALALQLILNEKEIIKLFASKKNSV